jgi:hypothetical protein
MNQMMAVQAFGVSSGGGAFGFAFAVIAAIVLIAAWVILAGSRFIQGGVVERPERVPQLYGYTVCLIALIWALASVKSIIENGVSLSAPELRGSGDFVWEPSVSSFEAFRATYDRVRQMNAGQNETKPDSIPEAELRRRYEGLRVDRIHRAQFEAKRGILVAALSLVLALALFMFHWRWLKRTVAVAAT